jgi:hypothetical protein
MYNEPMRTLSVRHRTVLSAWVGLMLLGILPVAAMAGTGVSKKIYVDPNPLHWFKKPDAGKKEAAPKQNQTTQPAKPPKSSKTASNKGLWPKKKKSAEPVASGPVEPPDKDYIVNNCEPIRNQVVAINRQPFFVRPFLRPKSALLKRKHLQCMDVFNQQELKFIKQFEFTESGIAPVVSDPNGDTTIRIQPGN